MSPDGWSWSVKSGVWLRREQGMSVKVESPRQEQALLRGKICIGYRVGIGFFFVLLLGESRVRAMDTVGANIEKKNKKVEREAK